MHPYLRPVCPLAASPAFSFCAWFVCHYEVRLTAVIGVIAVPLHLYHYSTKKILSEAALYVEQQKTHLKQVMITAITFTNSTGSKSQVRKNVPTLSDSPCNLPCPPSSPAQGSGGLSSFPEAHV